MSKAEVMAEVSDEWCLWDLALLCVISKQSHYLCSEYICHPKLASDIFAAVRTSEMKMELFRN